MTQKEGEVLAPLQKSVWRFVKETDKILLILCLLASFCGALLLYSATYTDIPAGGAFSSAMKTMIISITLGLIGALIISLVDFEIYAKLWPVIAAICLFMMVVTIVWGVGPDNGSDNTAWLKFGSFYFQASELLKIGFIITFSLHLNKVKDHINHILNVVLLGLHALIPIGLVSMTGDDGSALIFAFIFVGLLFVGGLHFLYLLAGGVLAVGAFAAAWYFDILKAFQKERFLVILYPGRDPQGMEYQQDQGLNAIGSGRLWGKGFLKGTYSQHHLVPASKNDFIITVAGEEFGLIGCIVVLLILLAITIRCVRVASKSPDHTGFLLCYGVMFMIASQTLLNIGMCLKLLPVIGITLPFFSSGGSANLCLYFAMGVVFSVFRFAKARYPISYKIL